MDTMLWRYVECRSYFDHLCAWRRLKLSPYNCFVPSTEGGPSPASAEYNPGPVIVMKNGVFRPQSQHSTQPHSRPPAGAQDSKHAQCIFVNISQLATAQIISTGFGARRCSIICTCSYSNVIMNQGPGSVLCSPCSINIGDGVLCCVRRQAAY